MHFNQVFDKLEKKELLIIIAYTALNGEKQRKKIDSSKTGQQ